MKTNHQPSVILPFPGLRVPDGYHCQTNSLAKIFAFHGHPLSEDMLLGLGAGMGFFYWHQKGTLPFFGGRTNLKSFFSDIGNRTSVAISVHSTASTQKAEKRLLELMRMKQPVMVFGDMAYLPWFDFPEEYHFGGHTFVLCAYDGEETLLASDMEPKTAGLKKSLFSPLTLEEVRKARNSPFKPFPPHNAWLEFDFSHFRFPTGNEVNDAIRQTATAMLNPPISNAGVKGFLRTAKEMSKWETEFDEKYLRLVLFNIYIFIEVGGTGGGCFRYMYARFLNEAADITGNRRFTEASEMIWESGRIFTETGLLFKNSETSKSLRSDKKLAKENLKKIASIEENAYNLLLESVKK